MRTTAGTSHDLRNQEARLETASTTGSPLTLSLFFFAWLAIGVYSGYATYQGFSRLNWGLMAVIVTVLSQLGAMIYPFFFSKLSAANVIRQSRKPLALAVILLVGFLFHAISFYGSLYHHKESSVAHRSQRNVAIYQDQYQQMAESARFNLHALPRELEKLGDFYGLKEEEEIEGKGVTQITRRGPYAKSYSLLQQATKNVSLGYDSNGRIPIIVFPENITDTEAFELIQRWRNRLPDEATRSASDQALDSLERWKGAAPRPVEPGMQPKQFEFFPESLSLSDAEDLVRAHVERFPFRKIEDLHPVLGNPEEVLEAVTDIIHKVSSTDDQERASAQAGFFGAALTELLTVVINLALAVALWTRQRRAKILPMRESFVAVWSRLKPPTIQDPDFRMTVQSTFHESLAQSSKLAVIGDRACLDLGPDLDAIVLSSSEPALMRSFLAHGLEANLVRSTDEKFYIQVEHLERWLASLPYFDREYIHRNTNGLDVQRDQGQELGDPISISIIR